MPCLRTFLLLVSLVVSNSEVGRPSSHMLPGQPSESNEEFQQAIKRAVPAGFVFKGVPKHFTHRSGRAAGAALLAEHAVQEMLACAGPGTEFGLRARVTPYPDEVVSVWVMLCAKHPA